MDSQALANGFKYNSPQKPVFRVVDSSIQYTSNAFAKTNNSTDRLKDASFSVYHRESTQKSLKKNENGGRSLVDDTEISIFDAQKYFSEINDVKQNDLVSVERASSVSSMEGYGRNYRTRSFNATPTSSSEASWNSQTGLLAHHPGSMAVSLKNFPSDMDVKRRSGSSSSSRTVKKWSFGRKCCCTGKNSVKVKEDTEIKGTVTINDEKVPASGFAVETPQQKAVAVVPKTIVTDPPPTQQRVLASGKAFGNGTGGAGFTFPILNSSIQKGKPGGGLKTMKSAVICSSSDEPPRESLEVFQPLQVDTGSPISRTTNVDDDMYSDASSDLFEIESFSTQTTSYQTYRGRDSLDEDLIFNPRRFPSANSISSHNLYGRRSVDEPPTPSGGVTDCYAPSEVSVDWSVTTAEGYDKASLTNFSISASEIGNVACIRRRMQEECCNKDNSKKKGGGGGLLQLSCRQQKAVSVVPQPVKCVPPEGPHMFSYNISGNGATVHVGGRPPPRANKPPLGSSHTARLSLAFAA